MIKLKMDILQNDRLYATFQRLMESQMDIKAAFKVKKYAHFLDQEQKQYAEFMMTQLKKYEELDEKGMPVIEYTEVDGEKKPMGYKLREEEKFKEVLKDFFSTEFTIPVHPLFAVELSGLGISPVDLTTLEPFIADMDNL